MEEIFTFNATSGALLDRSNIEAEYAAPVLSRYQSIASIGRVLGNRDTLFKYLHPIHVITTVDDHNQRTTIRIFDRTSGGLIDSLSHPDFENATVEVSVQNNWIIATATLNAGLGSRSTVVSIELYESNSRSALQSYPKEEANLLSFVQIIEYSDSFSCLSFPRWIDRQRIHFKSRRNRS